MAAATSQSEVAALADEYARALLDLASERGLAVKVEDELFGLAELARQVEGLADFLATPIVPAEEKIEAVSEAIRGAVSELAEDFMAVLLRNRRGPLLGAIARAYRRELDRRTGRRQVRVTSAVALTDYEKRQLAEALRQAIGAEPAIDAAVDPDLLGGIRVQVGERVIDASIQGQLRQLRETLSRRGREDGKQGQ